MPPMSRACPLLLEGCGQGLGRRGGAVPACLLGMQGTVRDLPILLPRPGVLRTALPAGGSVREPALGQWTPPGQ